MSVRYVISEGLAGFSRAKLAAFTSIFSLFVAILLIGVLARFAFNAYLVGEQLRQSITVEVFLDDLDPRSEADLREEITRDDVVGSVSYISKDSAAAIFRKEFGSEGASMASLKFLPASLRLTMNSSATVTEIRGFTERVSALDGVDEVDFNQQLLELLETRLRNLVSVGSGVILLIIFAAMILVFNTIRLTIYAKRNLIKAMKLVGATNGFIRRPFLMEGVLQGILAATAAIGIHVGIFRYLIPQYLPRFGVMAWPYGRWYYLIGAMALLGILMGYFGSRWAARKFIRSATISE